MCRSHNYSNFFSHILSLYSVETRLAGSQNCWLLCTEKHFVFIWNDNLAGKVACVFFYKLLKICKKENISNNLISIWKDSTIGVIESKEIVLREFIRYLLVKFCERIIRLFLGGEETMMVFSRKYILHLHEYHWSLVGLIVCIMYTWKFVLSFVRKFILKASRLKTCCIIFPFLTFFIINVYEYKS